MTLTAESGPGFYGKLPVLGDFVSRRLSPEFIGPWDRWLQDCLNTSRQALGEDWLPAFLVSPIWRFALSPGLCGPSAYAGIMMPSVDKVGRYFPLTLAQAIDAEDLPAVFLADSDWFEHLEDLALSVLAAGFDFDRFDNALRQAGIDRHLSKDWQAAANGLVNRQTAIGQVFHYHLAGHGQIVHAFPRLSQNLIGDFCEHYSFWAAGESPLQPAQFIGCEGLPRPETFTGFLNGKFDSKVSDLSVRSFDTTAVEPAQEGVQPAASGHAQTSAKRWRSHGITVAGNVRKQNEDAMLNNPACGVWAVADGMGGHHSGDVASRSVVEALAGLDAEGSIHAVTAKACDILQQINGELSQLALSIDHQCVVGSTVVALLARVADCAVVWAGDSRLYRFRNGELTQLTRDHTLVDELIELNGFSREQALLQTGANVITRAVGGETELHLDSFMFEAEPDDRYLLCSDGLDKELSDLEISALLAYVDCRTAAEQLIEHALGKNGRDNITVVVADYR